MAALAWLALGSAGATEPAKGDGALPKSEAVSDPNAELQITGQGLRTGDLVLTFDDGPTPFTLEIARFLHKHHISATFFVNGSRTCRMREGVCVPALRRPECEKEGPRSVPIDEVVLSQLVALGHTIANHTQSHCQLAENPGWAEAELEQTHDILVRQGARFPFLFRAPYGAWTKPAADVAHEIMCREGLIGSIFWDVRAPDWMCARDGLSPQQCRDLYLTAIDSSPARGGLLLIHDRNEFAPGTNYALRLTQLLVEALEDRPLHRFVPMASVPSVKQMAQLRSKCVAKPQ